jgi:hypothetical protein
MSSDRKPQIQKRRTNAQQEIGLLDQHGWSRTGCYFSKRSDLADPLFADEVPFSRLLAWLWLGHRAAWGTTRHAVGRMCLSVGKGQILVTYQGLANVWRWDRSKVTRFLNELREHGRIRTQIINAKGETLPDTARTGAATLITICNYGNLQKSAKADNIASQGHLTQSSPQATGNMEDSRLKESKEQNKYIRGRRSVPLWEKEKPKHGAICEEKGTVWFDYGAYEWNAYAADFKEARGYEPPLQKYRDGEGRWFNRLGEVKWPGSASGHRKSSNIGQQSDRLNRLTNFAGHKENDPAGATVSALNAEGRLSGQSRIDENSQEIDGFQLANRAKLAGS